MSAYRQAMLSIPPERLEQFSLEVKQNIASKKRKKSQNRHKHLKSKKSEKKYKTKYSESNLLNSKTYKSKKKDALKKHKSHRKKRKSSSERENLTDDSDIEENGLNLSFPLHPLSYYVKDRKNLCDILFRIVKGNKLSAMLPDILKETPIEELKQRCFSHLEVMSSKRINHILLGEAMQSSSGTESDDEPSGFNEAVAKEQLQNPSKSNTNDDNYNLQTNLVDSTTSSGCEVLSLLAAGSKQDTKHHEINESNEFKESSSSPSSKSSIDSQTDSDVEEEIETVEIVEDEEYVNMVDEILEETLAPSDDPDNESSIGQCNKEQPSTDKNMSQLELLELQLRARAIKSLMKASQPEKNNTPK